MNAIKSEIGPAAGEQPSEDVEMVDPSEAIVVATGHEDVHATPLDGLRAAALAVARSREREARFDYERIERIRRRQVEEQS